MLAANLRRMRIARHLSLSQLARATDMSKATLSGIENGRANPTVETLASLAHALGASLGELLQEPPLAEVRMVRARQQTAPPRSGAPGRLLDTVAGGDDMEIVELVLAAGDSRELAPRAAGARAHLYVRSGSLLAGPVEQQTELAVGDYLSFPADLPHMFEAVRQSARALLLTRGAG